jgi:hypothetical protein
VPTTYTLADERIHAAAARVMREFHRPLHEAGVKLGILLAYNPEGPAIRHNGAPCRATIQVVPLKDRLTKGYDAELTIDQAECDLMREAHLVALVDHELCHLDVKLKKPKRKKGEKTEPTPYVERDDLGRPKLKSRPGNWDAGDGFHEVCERHGEFAPEFENLRRCWAAAEAAKNRGKDAGGSA